MTNQLTNPQLKSSHIEALKHQLAGVIIQPEDEAYEEARKLYNGMIDKRPRLIVKCAEEADVKAAIQFARKHQMEVAIRSGGHNGAGLGSCDDGLLIDFSLMKAIHIDPEQKTARIEAGCTLGDIDKAMHSYGLAIPSGIISTTGIGGITLGGGIGYLTRKCGLTIDNLLEAQMVLADGSSVTANKDSHPDLFWAIRGGGGNFGVVTSFVFQLHEIKEVYAGPMFWPLEKSREVMEFYRDFTVKASNDLYGFFAFLVVPPTAPFPEELQGQNVCGIVWNYTGPAEKAEEVFKPIREFGPPVLDFVGWLPLPALQSMFDIFYPPGHQWYWRADFFEELTDEAITAFIKYGAQIPTGQSTMHLYPVDGKAHEVKSDETAWNYRHARWAEVIVGVDPDPAHKEKITAWCKNYYHATHPYSAGGAYINFMMEEGQDRIKATYGSNYDRLTEVKAKYDPDNFFHVNQNIQPKAALA